MSRNKRKREQKKQVKKGLIALIKDLKQENKNLSDKMKVETTIKEKYFEMWRVSEKEKGKMRNAKLVFHGASNQVARDKGSEILKIDPSLLEEVEGAGELGKGKFGSVQLKKFRSSPVAVKYFNPSTSAKDVTHSKDYKRLHILLSTNFHHIYPCCMLLCDQGSCSCLVYPLLHYQIVAEFERILGLGTSILTTFKNNFQQVLEPIILVAKKKKGKASGEVGQYLNMLESEFAEDDDTEPTPGTYRYVYNLSCCIVLTGRLYSSSVFYYFIYSNINTWQSM